MSCLWRRGLAAAALVVGIGSALAACQPTAARAVDAPPLAAERLPRTGIWVTYSGELSSNRNTPQEARVSVLEGGGFLGSFSVLLRRRNPDGSIEAEQSPDPSGSEAAAAPPTHMLIRSDGRALLDGAELLVSAAKMHLPTANGGPWFDAKLRDAAAGLLPESLRQARRASLQLDLAANQSAAAANLCRSLDRAGPGEAVSDRCIVEAFVDRGDGWPIVLRIARTRVSTDGSQAQESVSFWRAHDGAAPPRR